MKSTLFTSCILATVAGAGYMQGYCAVPEGMTIQKTITPNTPGFQNLFEGFEFFPGQEITLVIAGGPIDVNHRFWEDRRCNWLGLHCWYEQRDAPNFYKTDVFPVLIQVTPEKANQKLTSPDQAESDSFSMSKETTIVAPAPAFPETITFEVDLDGSDTQMSLFASRLRILGKVGDKGKNGVVMNRDPCVSRNTCSGGAYIASVSKVNNTRRLTYLKTFLGSGKVALANIADAVRSDLLFSRDPDVRQQIANLMFETATQRYGNDKTNPDYVAALEAAAELDEQGGVGDIGNALSEAYLRSGNYALAKLRTGGDSTKLENLFKQDESNLTVRRAYIANIRLSGDILVGQRSAIYSSDLVRAVAMYKRASDLASEVCEDPTVSMSADERREIYALAYGSLVDASRALMMARTEENLLQAEVITDKALILAQKSISIKD